MTFRPTALTFNSTLPRAKPYDAADIPVPSYMVSPGVDRTVLMQQFAYEWYDQSGRYSMGSNPPFTKGSAGRLLPQFLEDGSPRRILRGFIRRSEYDVADMQSGARLYFMYNPETITRDYVSYLDQGALDPFNTVFQAGNLVPPPSFMDFDFSLLFDRQEEAAQDGNHPGVFVDYEYFDLVVRNVVPNYNPGSGIGSAELPDNGVMMVNPRDITVVFSPNITVQGRPKNARVSFTKFTHRMIPIRMQIDLTIRVTYFGPMKDMVEYTQEQAVVTDSVPWNIETESPFTITNAEIMETNALFLEKMVEGSNLLSADQIKEKVDGLTAQGLLSPGAANVLSTTGVASGDLNTSIAEWGLKMINDNPTLYCGDNAPSGTARHNLWGWGDCSSWIWAVFASHPSKPNASMGPTWSSTFESKKNIPATEGQLTSMRNGSCPVKEIFYSRDGNASTRSKIITPNLPLLMPGDLIYRKAGVIKPKGHVAMVYSNDSAAQQITYVHCGGPRPVPSNKGTMSYSTLATSYTEGYRPMLGNPDSPGNRSLIGNDLAQ